MALHEEPATLSVEVIEEYLSTVEVCLQHRKPDGGCLGYSATLLLFCTVEALGNCLRLNGTGDIKRGEPFQVLNHSCLGLTLHEKQIKRLEELYRNGLAHNGTLSRGVSLSTEDGQPFDFAPNGDPVKIRIPAFHHLVAQAWNRFDRSLLASASYLHPQKAPTMGFEIRGASSGCPLPDSPGVKF